MIDAPLFATGLAIKNFRGYGSFRVTLPSRPCVVLLSGPNGLGKTSLFEALEWGLTGAVKRLDVVSGRSADPRDLARRAPGVDAFEVEVSFRDADGKEERVSRTQLVPPAGTVPPAVGTTISAVADLLGSQDPRWNVTGANLADYLHLTHLHAQVAFLRLVTSQPKERWVRVSPLAGADRFERVRTNLTNSKAALTKLKDRRASELDQGRTRQQQWLERVARLDELRKVATAVRDVLPPSDVVSRLADLASRLGIAFPRRTLASDNDVAAASEALSDFRAVVRESVLELERRLDSLGRLRASVKQASDLRSQQVLLRDGKVKLGLERAGRAAEADRLAGTIGPLVAHEAEAQTRLKQSIERHRRLTAIHQDRLDLVRLEKDSLESTQEFATAERRLEEAEVELRRRREDLASHETRQKARDRARLRLEEVERAVRSLEEIEALQKRLEVEKLKQSVLMDDLRKSEAAANLVAVQLTERDGVVTGTERVMADFQRASTAVHQALLTIVEHIREDDEHCPVCRSGFEHGRLLLAARESLDAIDPRLGEHERRLATLRAEREDIRGRQSNIAQESRRIEADLRAVADNIAQIGSRIAKLSADPLLSDATLDDARARLSQARDEARQEVGAIDTELAAARSPAELKQLLLEGSSASDTARRARALAEEKRTARQARLAEVVARVEQFEKEHSELAGQDVASLVGAAALDVSKAKALTEEAATALAKARTSEAAARQALDLSTEALGGLQAQEDVVQATLDGLVRQWRDASLPEEMTAAVLDDEVERSGSRRRELDRTSAELKTLSSSLEEWHRAADLQRLEDEVRAEHSPLDRESYSRQLDEEVRRLEKALTTAARARDAAEDLSATLKKVTTDFGGRALKPFDELFRRYLRALIHDERFHSIEAAYEAGARSAGLKFLVDLGGSGTEAEYILSEGQLGEVSLAAMLAASTTFPWSRWRALLLDDPTQYNDLIHATALFDVLRNLVRSAGYQIVISTHETEQAGFFRRKLDSIGVPWVDCRYVAHGEDGIVADTWSGGAPDGSEVRTLTP